jgi:hypothetical protein
MVGMMEIRFYWGAGGNNWILGGYFKGCPVSCGGF